MSTSDASWHEALSSNFLKARELDPSSRAAFIRKLRDSDAEMSSWVERMIAAEESHSPLLGSSTGESFIRFTAPDMTNARIGRYTITRKLGAGGMGVVYEAIQDQPQRNVAIKVLSSGTFSPLAARRFEYESGVLARLQHPGIARIIEAGLHDAGGLTLPYIAMELAQEAMPITSYLREQKLPLRGVLELFIRVCDAIQYGHRRGVIHRDLKPDNVLVDTEGNPKVIDFGVARAIERDDSDSTFRTEAGQLVGTLPYMSPEQVGGAQPDLDVRTDVYALGVLLFESLTGRLPYELNSSIADTIQTIQSREAAKPSSLDPSIPSDLDTIIGKALRKEREQRYDAVSDFSADLQRFLNNEPIAARSLTLGYQLRKFSQRNKTLVAASLALLLALIGGVIAERYRANQAIAARNTAIAERAAADEARGQALLEATRARTVVGILGGMLQEAATDQARGRNPTVQEALDNLAVEIDNGVIESPEVEATVRLIIGDVYHRQARFAKARTALEAAAAIHEELGLRNEETMSILRLLAGVDTSLGAYDDALTVLDRIDAMLDDSDGRYDSNALTVATFRANILFGRGRADDAIRAVEKTLSSYPQLSDEKMYHVLRGNLGTMLANVGRADEAAELLREEIDWLSQATDGPPPEVLAMARALAFNEYSRGDIDAAIRILNDATEMFADAFGEAHPDMADALEDLGRLLNRQKRSSAAEPRLRESIAIREKLFGEDHLSLAQPLCFLSIAVARQGRQEEAIKLQRRALAIQEALGATQTPLYSQSSALLTKLEAGAGGDEGARDEAVGDSPAKSIEASE
ncbi:MAG TPA: serine/threonine-protein kinase [Phycisphaerae bacterium]|nr:serine/threonine-protein kinase [Phycisphaerae bacterium]